jgi:hypothetical protein
LGNSQVQWPPPEAIWTYELSGPFMNPPYSGYYKLYNPHDTIVAGEVVTTFDYVMGSIEPWLVENGIENNPDFLPPIIKQEGRKIYRFIRNQFHLLYDFDAEVGDTLAIVIVDLSLPQDSVTYLEVVEKRLVDIEGNEVLGMKLKSLGIGNYPHSWTIEGWHYEGIGSEVYFNPANPTICDWFCIPKLRCYFDSTVSINLSDRGCEEIVIHSNTSEFDTKEAEINVFPNPVHLSESVTLQLPSVKNGRVEVEVIDLSGRRIAYEKIENVNNEITFPFNLASSGIYFLIIQTPESRTTSKLTVVD